MQHIGMTTQAKKLIDLPDVVALHFTCKNCEATMSVSPQEYDARKKKEGSLQACPLCSSPWALVGGATCEPIIGRFVEGLLKLMGTLAGEHAFPVGFGLRLEVKDEENLLTE